MSNQKTEILVVDDSPTIRATIAKYLGDEYSTLAAADGEEGWKLLQTNEHIALVFSDMHMPVMNGMLMLQRIRESDCERIANIPVIMITGHDDTEAAKKATHNLGATDFLGKPFDKVDILSRAQAYTRLNEKITALEKEIAYDAQTGLYNNRLLIDFGTKTLSFGKRYNMVASILYAEIAGIEDCRELYGNKAVDSIIHTVADHLEQSVRKEELVSHIDETRFAIVLPNTKAFKAHIVATRLKQTVENLIFEIGNEKLRLKLALGLCSTEDSEQANSLSFEEYCVLASHALAASLDTPNKRITRYDETYEKKVTDDAETVTAKIPEPDTIDIAESQSFSKPAPIDSDEDAAEAFGNFFACIWRGDFGAIPVEFLPSMIEPLEHFIEYARATTKEDEKISGE